MDSVTTPILVRLDADTRDQLTAEIVEQLDLIRYHAYLCGQRQLTRREELISRIVCAYISGQVPGQATLTVGDSSAERGQMCRLASLWADAIISQATWPGD